MSDLRLSPVPRERPARPPHPQSRGPGGAFFICLGLGLTILLLLTEAIAQTIPRRPIERDAGAKRLESRRPGTAKGSTGKKGEAGKSDKKEGKDATAPEEEEGLFLAETPETQTWLPDIWRCPECGYEQDEPGTCPDHGETELVKVLAKGKNPLAPAELDGNEDLVVDIPLTGLVLRKTPVTVATGTAAPPTGPAPPRTPPRH